MSRFAIFRNGMTHIYIRLWGYLTLTILLKKWGLRLRLGQADW